MRARALAVLGTGSDVGKSVIAAALGRLLFRSGIRVAPFKAQNMSNNSCVTQDGKEMGRAQVLQAQACGVSPHADMNPVLLKPESDRTAQIVVQGTVWGKSDARDYFTHHEELARRVKESYDRLATSFDMIVIEGAGSAAELNLRDRDLANWSMVETADARVVLVADIDRGGVFAQVIGTLDLVEPGERARVIGVIINKFRGDPTLFEDGVRMIEQRTGIPVLGVVPMLQDLVIDQEDSVAVERATQRAFDPSCINVAVLLVRRMSNFTDVKHVAAEPDVRVRYVTQPDELAGADVIIIPGSKNSMEDLHAVREKGFPDALRAHASSGREIIGICGGFQMLGREIVDPDGVESGGSVPGMGLLDVSTVISPVKTTELVEAQALHLADGRQESVSGYAIHMGVTRPGDVHPCFRLSLPTGSIDQNLSPSDTFDGAVSHDGLVWGTYIHGVFDRPGFRRTWLNSIRRRKGWDAVGLDISEAVSRRLDGELDRWADHVGRHMNCEPLFSVMENNGGIIQQHPVHTILP
ncbi:MAG: cobyric acid synthase [Nitrospira sp.]|nr:cobyric acid synthase [Nitrospira sp.]